MLEPRKKDFIKFHPGGDCHSKAGRQGGGQVIVLASYCAEEHTLIHEILHALGLLHEHQRPDRDQYVDVNMTAANFYGFSNDLRKECF